MNGILLLVAEYRDSRFGRSRSIRNFGFRVELRKMLRMELLKEPEIGDAC